MLQRVGQMADHAASAISGSRARTAVRISRCSPIEISARMGCELVIQPHDAGQQAQAAIALSTIVLTSEATTGR